MLVCIIGSGVFYEMNKTGVLRGKKMHICELRMGINDHLDLCINGRRNAPLKIN